MMVAAEAGYDCHDLNPEGIYIFTSRSRLFFHCDPIVRQCYGKWCRERSIYCAIFGNSDITWRFVGECINIAAATRYNRH